MSQSPPPKEEAAPPKGEVVDRDEHSSQQTAPAEAIGDFPALYPRQVGLNRYSVLSLSGDHPTAYQVDVANLNCDCPDHVMRNSNGDEQRVCKHIAAALEAKPRNLSVEQLAYEHLQNEATKLTDLVEQIEDEFIENGVAQPTAAGGSTATSDGSHNTEPPADDTARVCRSLKDAGVPLEKLDVYESDEYDSVQIEKTGDMDDDEWDAYSAWFSQDAVTFDSDNSRNYVRAENVGDLDP